MFVKAGQNLNVPGMKFHLKNLTHPDKKGMTAVHHSLTLDAHDIVKLLLSAKGIDLSLSDAIGTLS